MCPNRDGNKGFGGCVYCDVEGSGTGALRRGSELAQQLQVGLARVARRHNPGPAIAYFQSYSNTYVDAARLAEVLEVVAPHLGREVAVISIATRPDTLSDDALDLLERWNSRVPVWVEIGLECADDTRLIEINRLHTVADFVDAVARTRARGMTTIGHAILGLPGDGRDGARRTAEVFAASGVEGVKVHQLMVLKKTILARWFAEGRVDVLALDVYIDWLADFVERLRADQVLHRLHADARPEELVAPSWTPHANQVREDLERELERRGTRQGSARQDA